MFVNTLLLAISSSIDSLGIGITYGLRKTKLSKLDKILDFYLYITFRANSVLYDYIFFNNMFRIDG